MPHLTFTQYVSFQTKTVLLGNRTELIINLICKKRNSVTTETLSILCRNYTTSTIILNRMSQMSLWSTNLKEENNNFQLLHTAASCEENVQHVQHRDVVNNIGYSCDWCTFTSCQIYHLLDNAVVENGLDFHACLDETWNAMYGIRPNENEGTNTCFLDSTFC